MLRQDSVRLQALNEEIQNLKSFLGTADLTDSAATEAQSSVQEKLQEKASLDSQIAEKLAMLDEVQSELDNRARRGGSNTGMIVFISILGALVIVLAVVLIFILMNKPKQQMPPLPPWMMYPPRPKKKDNSNRSELVKQPAAPATPPPAPEPPKVEDIGVLQSEVNDMKQAVVSMSVGQPQAATKIVKDWILEEAPPEPEPAPADAEEDDGGKKKKKKKKK